MSASRTAPPLPRPGHLVLLLQATVLAALPDGGQRTARRNAWAGRSALAVRARQTREAAGAVERAARRHEAATRAVVRALR